MTELELRKHIKPFLIYAKEEMAIQMKITGSTIGLCLLTFAYTEKFECSDKVGAYLRLRLDIARPRDAKKTGYWYPVNTTRGFRKRIEFIDYQLRVVDENKIPKQR